MRGLVPDEHWLLTRGRLIVLCGQRSAVSGIRSPAGTERARCAGTWVPDTDLLRPPGRSPASRALGTDFGIAGQWWADRVAVAWEAVVRSSFRSIRTEAERRARPGTAHSRRPLLQQVGCGAERRRTCCHWRRGRVLPVRLMK